MKHKHHIIPRHMGGSDNPDNIIELSIEEHANAHKILYEKYGCWQDYVAWQGLSGLIGREDIVKIVLSEAAKKGIRSRPTNLGKRYNTQKIISNGVRKGENNPCAKKFEVTFPDGQIITVKSLKTWCELHGLNYNTFHKLCVSQGKTHKGYSAKKI